MITLKTIKGKYIVHNTVAFNTMIDALRFIREVHSVNEI